MASVIRGSCARDRGRKQKSAKGPMSRRIGKLRTRRVENHRFLVLTHFSYQQGEEVEYVPFPLPTLELPQAQHLTARKS